MSIEAQPRRPDIPASGFVLDGQVIVGYIEVTGTKSDPDAEQLRKLGIAVSGGADVERVRVALPVGKIGPFYEVTTGGEAMVVAYVTGVPEAWYLRGQFGDFLKLYNDAKTAFRSDGE